MTFNKSLQYISFGESENITIQVSLVSSWSYVKMDYGITKQRLDSGKKGEEQIIIIMMMMMMML